MVMAVGLSFIWDAFVTFGCDSKVHGFAVHDDSKKLKQK